MKKLLASLACVGMLFALGSNAHAAMQYYGKNLCSYPGFSCYQVKPGQTWATVFPDKRERSIVQRLNRTNMPLSIRSWIVVPNNLKDITLLDLSPFPQKADTKGEKLVVVNVGLQAFGAYNKKGELVHWGPVSGGRDWCEDVGRPCRTATGEFKFYRKQGAKCESSQFPIETKGGAAMPFCMHYYRGFALHGSELPGYNASHGCVRMFYDDAKWLNGNFVTIGTKVIVMR